MNHYRSVPYRRLQASLRLRTPKELEDMARYAFTVRRILEIGGWGFHMGHALRGDGGLITCQDDMHHAKRDFSLCGAMWMAGRGRETPLRAAKVMAWVIDHNQSLSVSGPHIQKRLQTWDRMPYRRAGHVIRMLVMTEETIRNYAESR